MSEDKKEFYRRQLNADVSHLGIANMVLQNLANRWDERAEEIEAIMKSIKEFQALLRVEGHKGYHPKWGKAEDVKITIVRKADATTDTVIEAADLAKEIEAKRLAEEELIAEELRLKEEAEAEKKAKDLAEKKRLAEEKAKKIAEQKAKAKAEALAEKKALKLKELEELKAAKLLELEALDELKEETEEEA